MKRNELTVIKLTEESIESMVYEIRGQKVMLDFDLAKIYGYSTRRLNEQVKRNIEKFPEDFMFQLTTNEIERLSRSQIATTKNNWNESEEISRCIFCTTMQAKGIRGGRVYLPYAFTEQGIYMLMTVLRGELAVKQSKTLIRLFKRIKDYFLEIATNPNNTIVSSKRSDIIREYNRIADDDARIGYLVINDFKISEFVREKLSIDSKLLLLVSKWKIKKIRNEHGISAEQFINVIRKAAYSPEAIVFDKERQSFQFYVKLGDDSYRTVIEFGAVPIGMKNVRADILTTLFKNQNFEKRIERIQENGSSELITIYKRKSDSVAIETNITRDENEIKEKNCVVKKNKNV